MRVLTLNTDCNPLTVDQRIPSIAELVRQIDPDVVCLQEVLYRDGRGTTAEEVATAAGLRVVSAAAHDRHPAGHVNGVAILTGLPGEGVGALPLGAETASTARFAYQRRAAAASLETPAGRRLTVVTAHLAWGGDAEPDRLREAAALDTWAAQLGSSPSDAPEELAVLAGDFNCVPDADTLRFLTGLSVFDGRGAFWVDAWDSAPTKFYADADDPRGVPEGFTTGPENPWTAETAKLVGVSRPDLSPRRRLDYVMVRGWVHGRPGQPLQAAVVGTTPPGPGLVVPSDHYGVVADLWDPPTS